MPMSGLMMQTMIAYGEQDRRVTDEGGDDGDCVQLRLALSAGGFRNWRPRCGPPARTSIST